MAIVVETGAGLANAVSYASVAQADAYHAARGNSAWAGDTTAKEQALVRATMAVDALYAGRFPGYPLRGRDQALQWPRQGAYSQVPSGYLGLTVQIGSNEVPRELVNGICEGALRELASPGALNPDVSPGDFVTSESVAGAVSVTYAANRPTTTYFAALEGVMGFILTPSNSLVGRAERF